MMMIIVLVEIMMMMIIVMRRSVDSALLRLAISRLISSLPMPSYSIPPLPSYSMPPPPGYIIPPYHIGTTPNQTPARFLLL